MTARTSDPIGVLVVEDNPADARLVALMLAAADPAAFRVRHVARLADALPLLRDATGAGATIGDGAGAAGPHVVLLDLSLPDGHGLDLVARVHAAAPRVPIVIMSGSDDEDLAIAGVRAGAQDYLVKGRVEGDLLVRALRYAIERKRAEDRLSAKTREQEAFIYTVSHDLKAPLLSIQGMAGAIVEDYGDTLDPTARRYVDRIAANADKMQGLLRDLLELSRIGRVDLECEDVDLGTVVDLVTAQLDHTLRARGATVRVDGALPVVDANPTRMAQLFLNLIGNAVAYTPPDRVPLVTLRADDTGDRWEITVRDNGVGIPRAFHDKVLGIFQRLPDGRRLNPGGTGVGLAIVARVVEARGGELWFDSDEGVGTTVHATLPKRAAVGRALAVPASA